MRTVLATLVASMFWLGAISSANAQGAPNVHAGDAASRANAALLLSMFEAHGEGDIGFITARVSADCWWEFVGPQDIPIYGGFEGPEGVAAWFAADDAFYSETTIMEIHDVVAAGDKVVVTGYHAGTIAATDAETASAWVMVFTIEGGKVVQMLGWNDSADIAAGLSR